MKGNWTGYALSMLFLLAAAPAAAQGYPNKPVRLIVPIAPGGQTDLLARLVAQKLSEKWGQPVVIDNRAGASTRIGMNLAANSTPDGYTLVVANSAIGFGRPRSQSISRSNSLAGGMMLSGCQFDVWQWQRYVCRSRICTNASPKRST